MTNLIEELSGKAYIASKFLRNGEDLDTANEEDSGQTETESADKKKVKTKVS